MDNLLPSLAIGVFVIVMLHSGMRFFSRATSAVASLITLACIAAIYIPLLVIDWPGVDVFAIQIAIYCITVYLLTILHHQAIHKKSLGKNATSKWHWAPFALIGFFIVVVSVDSIFITIAQKGSDSFLGDLIIPKPKSGGNATSVFPGIIEHDYQEKEQQYNEHQKRLIEQRNRGWKVKYGWLEEPVAKKPAVFQVQLNDKNKEPIRNAKVSGIFQRGNSSSQDQRFKLTESSKGLYRTDITIQYPGRWALILKIESPQGDYDLNATTDVAE